jgi:hypothetical protein
MPMIDLAVAIVLGAGQVSPAAGIRPPELRGADTAGATAKAARSPSRERPAMTLTAPATEPKQSRPSSGKRALIDPPPKTGLCDGS